MQEQAESVNILSAMVNLQSAQEYQELNWEGSLEDYLKLSIRVRNAFPRAITVLANFLERPDVPALLREQLRSCQVFAP